MNIDWNQLKRWAQAEIESVVAEMPDPLRERVRQLVVTLERKPSPDLQAAGIECDTLGLFTGEGFTDVETLPLPPQIILFLENLWEWSGGSQKVFCGEVRTTFLHEVGHYLGLDEGDLRERGLE